MFHGVEIISLRERREKREEREREREREREGFMCQQASTRIWGLTKGMLQKYISFIIKNHTLLSTTKCRVGARTLLVT
jgi:hypothetical protein